METMAEFITPKAYATAPGRYVLRRNPDNEYHPWAVHWRNDQTGEFCWGGYHEDIRSAWADFDERVRKWTRMYAKTHGY